MGFWKKRNEEDLLEEKEQESEEDDDSKELEFYIPESLKGMTEKQLLKLLVLIEFDQNYEGICDDHRDLIQIAKEE